jgi:hypothetical protein
MHAISAEMARKMSFDWLPHTGRVYFRRNRFVFHNLKPGRKNKEGLPERLPTLADVSLITADDAAASDSWRFSSKIASAMR